MPAADTPPDVRPGLNLPSLAAAFLTLSTWSKPDAIAADEINRIAKHITDRQEADGAWPVPPPKKGPVPVFESRETMAIWLYLAPEPSVLAQPAKAGTPSAVDPKEPSKARTAREKAAEWLSKTPPETPERPASKNPAPIVYLGSAWATLGLFRANEAALNGIARSSAWRNSSRFRRMGARQLRKKPRDCSTWA